MEIGHPRCKWRNWKQPSLQVSARSETVREREVVRRYRACNTGVKRFQETVSSASVPTTDAVVRLLGINVNRRAGPARLKPD